MEKPKLEFKHKNRKSPIKRSPPTAFNNKDSESDFDSESEFVEFYMDLTIRKTILSKKSSLSDLQGDQYCTRFIASSSKNKNKNSKHHSFFQLTCSYARSPHSTSLHKQPRSRRARAAATHVSDVRTERQPRQSMPTTPR